VAISAQSQRSLAKLHAGFAIWASCPQSVLIANAGCGTFLRDKPSRSQRSDAVSLRRTKSSAPSILPATDPVTKVSAGNQRRKRVASRLYREMQTSCKARQAVFGPLGDALVSEAASLHTEDV